MKLFDVPSFLASFTPIARPSSDCPAFNIDRDQLYAATSAMKGEGYSLLVDLTAIDWGVDAPVRFSGVYHFYKPEIAEYLRIVVDCTSLQDPVLPSIVSLYPGADWHEREAYDMFGIKFEGHPGLRRILMWEGYPYHPLRKDFPLAGIEVPLPAADTAAATGAKVIAAPMMGGPFHAKPGATMADREPAAADQSWSEHNVKP